MCGAALENCPTCEQLDYFPLRCSGSCVHVDKPRFSNATYVPTMEDRIFGTGPQSIPPHLQEFGDIAYGTIRRIPANSRKR